MRHRGTLALAIAGLLALALPAVASAATQTIDFEGLTPGTKVSNQFDSLGIDFANGIVPASAGENVACYPVVTAIGSGAHSGTQVGDTSCANGEFPDSSLWGTLTDTATTISAYVGFAPSGTNPDTSATVGLDGYDIDGNVVASSSVTVTAGGGTQTPLSITTSTPSIVSFGIYSVGDPGVEVDDVSFDVPAGLTPDFGISAQGGSVQPIQGGSATDQINIRRVNGSTGTVTLSASGLPAGVHASFSPNPATSATTMTVSADPSAAALTSGSIPSFTVTGTPDSSTDGPAAHSTSEAVEVLPVFSVNEPSVQVPPCSTLHVPITVHAPASYSGTLTLSASGGPADDQASFSPATLSYPAQTQTTLTITGQSDVSGPSGAIAVTVTGDNGISDVWHVPVSRVAPSISSLSGNDPTDLLSGGLTPQGPSSEGTIVVVHGQGFCPGSTVYFGNAEANAPGAGPFTDGLGPYGDETAFRVYVPSLATSGRVYVVPPSGSLLSAGTASAPFTVDNYRDTDGFAFVNSDTFQSNVGGYSWGDIVDVFGYDATHVSVNPCWPFGDCSIATPIPDPLAAIFWGIADETLGSGGQCFGFGLASQRLLAGQQSYSPFPLQPGLSQDSVWNLAGPDPSSGASGASGATAHFIHLMHVEQYSRQALGFWLTKAVGNAVNGSQTSLMNDVTSALAAGEHPLVEMRDGSEGHVVVAYAVDQADGNSAVGPGDRVIDVYNPNTPYTTGETNLNGVTHQQTLATSQIIVHSDGHWEFKGFSPEWSAGPGSLVVMPASTIPVQPSLPLNVSDIISVTFGAADATQISEPGGHDLLGKGGAIDNSAKTGIPDATQFAPLVGTNTPGANMFLLGHSGAYTTTVQGTGSGEYHTVLLSHGDSASISAAVGRTDTDTLTTPANLGGLQFGAAKGSGGRDASVELVGHGDHGELTATVSTTMPAQGQAGVSFTSGDSGVAVTAGGQATSARLTLTWAGKDGVPQTFKAPRIKLAAGDRAKITPSSWSALASGKLAVSIRHRNGRTTRMTLHNRIRPADRYSVALAVRRTGKRRTLQVRTHFTRLVAKSNAVIAFEVLRGHRLVAKHVVSLSGKRLHRGTIKESYSFRPSSGSYRFRAPVLVLSPTKGGGYIGDRVVRTKRFH